MNKKYKRIENGIAFHQMLMTILILAIIGVSYVNFCGGIDKFIEQVKPIVQHGWLKI